jgi:NADH-quinone oxidoreductase subunit N
VGSYPLVAARRGSPRALEAVLKYYLIGALANLSLILGMVLLYALAAGTLLSDLAAVDPANRVAAALALALTLAGLGFKAGWVPAHFWVPDTYQASPVPVAAFLSVVPKVAALLAAARLAQALPEALGWPLLVAGLAAVTMTWGNLAAWRQQDIRRLLGWSSVSQSGYLLMGVAALPASGLALSGLLYHFLAYALANLGAFAVLAAAGRHGIEGNAGLARQRPLLALAMAVCLLSFMGLPPLAGFVGKFLLFAAAWEAGLAWLVVLALANTLISLYYYLRVIGPMFLGSAEGGFGAGREGSAVAGLGMGLTILAGVGAWWPLGVVQSLRLLP